MAEKLMKTFYVGEPQLYYILCGDCDELLSFEEGGNVVGEQVEIKADGCQEVITATILNVAKTPYSKTSDSDSFCYSMLVDLITLGNVECKISIEDPEGLLDKQSN
jgi:hypothetical protein